MCVIYGAFWLDCHPLARPAVNADVNDDLGQWSAAWLLLWRNVKGHLVDIGAGCDAIFVMEIYQECKNKSHAIQRKSITTL